VDPKVAAFLAQNHAWFAAYSPSRAPEIAVVVLAEHGGSGPAIGAPMAIQVIREYNRLQAARAGRPVPPRPPQVASVGVPHRQNGASQPGAPPQPAPAPPQGGLP